jgi:hypothetical protein
VFALHICEADKKKEKKSKLSEKRGIELATAAAATAQNPSLNY